MKNTVIYDVETDGLIDTCQRVHCVVAKPFMIPKFAIYVAADDLDEIREWAKRKITGDYCILPFYELHHIFGDKERRLVAHNQLGFDAHILSRFFNIDMTLNQMVDTLVMSRYLYPDRGGHSLEDWVNDERVSGEKIQLSDWQGGKLPTYVTRCLHDVYLNEQVYHILRQEFHDEQLHEGYRLAQYTYMEMQRQERTGILFNKMGGINTLNKIQEEMDHIASRVEPQFGTAPLPQSKQPLFPAKPYKKNGELSATSFRYAAKFGVTDAGAVEAEIQRGLKEGPRKHYAPITLSNMEQVKEYLFTEHGWKPTIWRMNDITQDSKKQKETAEKKRKRADKYIKDTWHSPYREMVWEMLEVDDDLRVPYDELDEIKMGKIVLLIMRKGKGLPMSPQIADQFKNICPNLEELQGEMVKDIIRWMSLKNRRGVLTSWLTHPRLGRDSRLPAASSGVSNTHRQRHAVVVNLPSADEKVVYGKEIRSLFVAPPGQVYVGYDASGLEARIAGHLAAEFDGGAYAHEVLEGDIHIKNAAAYSEAIGREVTRKESKSPTYALMYGCSSRKLATMFNVPISLGQNIIDAFWEANPGLKGVVDKLNAEWKASGRRWVRTVDGRKVWTRSGHSLLNAIIQSTGAIIMDRSWEIFCRFAGQCRSSWERVLYMHDEYALHVDKEIALAIGDLAVDSIIKAGEFYNLRVPLDGEAKIGDNYAEVH